MSLKRVNRKQTKKKITKINKQLNLINKNIQSTSKNMHNPEEFYASFFKNILDKETNLSSHNNNKIGTLLQKQKKEKEQKEKPNLFKHYFKDNLSKKENISVSFPQKEKKK